MTFKYDGKVSENIVLYYITLCVREKTIRSVLLMLKRGDVTGSKAHGNRMGAWFPKVPLIQGSAQKHGCSGAEVEKKGLSLTFYIFFIIQSVDALAAQKSRGERLI